MARARWIAMAAAALAACSSKPVEPPIEAPTPPVESTDAAQAPVADAAPPEKDPVTTVQLAGDTPVDVPDTPLRAHISGSFHKIRAPLVGVSVLVVKDGTAMAEVTWRIESGQVDSSWRAIEGRRFDEPSGTYKEELIADWQVRLDSVDKTSAGGDPRAITISFQRTP